MLAAVAEAAAEEPTSRHSSEGAEAAPLRQQQSFPGFAMHEAAAGGMQYAMQVGASVCCAFVPHANPPVAFSPLLTCPATHASLASSLSPRAPPPACL